jgi:Zn-dependent peptidase ImmA (M78 family)
VAFRRGFKAEAAGIAADVRSELGVGVSGRLDPRGLAGLLGIPIIDLSSLEAEAPAVRHLLDTEPEVFSAVTVFAGRRRTIVHNDGHGAARQNSNICHELSHGLLQHPPTPALDNSGCRIWNQDTEDEAVWLGGCLLVPEQAALATARGRWTIAEAAGQLGVSEAMIRYRINATGAAVRVQRAALAGRR